ncbi:MAG: hypothetical protein AB7F98_08275 [Novosphingobium sp.]
MEPKRHGYARAGFAPRREVPDRGRPWSGCFGASNVKRSLCRKRIDVTQARDPWAHTHLS